MANMPVVRAGEVTDAGEEETDVGVDVGSILDDDSPSEDSGEESSDSLQGELEAAFAPDNLNTDSSQEEQVSVEVPDAVVTQKGDRLQITFYRSECLRCGNLFPQLGEKHFGLDQACSAENGNKLCPAGWFAVVVQSKSRRRIESLIAKIQDEKSAVKRLEFLSELTARLQGQDDEFVQDVMRRVGIAG